MRGSFQPNPSFYWAISFIIGTPILISLVLGWIGLERIHEYETHQRDVGTSTIKLVAEDIRAVIEEKKRLVNIYAEINRSRLAKLANQPENSQLHAAMQQDLQRWFPNMFAYTISDATGSPFLEDFDGYIGSVCLDDMRSLAIRNDYSIRLHPNPYAYHYDIMAKWGDDTFGGIFFVSFKPEVIVRRLIAASPPGHELTLIIKEREYLVEITESGSREKTPREDYRMSAQDKDRIIDMVPIANTDWQLVDLQTAELFSNFRKHIYVTYGAIISAFLLGSLIISVLLVYFEKQRLAASRMRDEMMSLFSHDLRSPLVSILGAIGLLQNRTDTHNPDDRRLLELTYYNAKSMNRIVDDILDIHKLESGKIDFDFELIDITSTCRKACDINQSYAQEFAVFLTHDMAEQIIQVKADEQRLLQALTNLITNAIKYSPENGTVTIHCQAKNNTVEIAIEDHGVGIPKAYQNQLFTKFTQAKQPVRKKVASTGLGLAIVKSIVEAHDGHVHFASVEGAGTTFYVELPLAD